MHLKNYSFLFVLVSIFAFKLDAYVIIKNYTDIEIEFVPEVCLDMCTKKESTNCSIVIEPKGKKIYSQKESRDLTLIPGSKVRMKVLSDGTFKTHKCTVPDNLKDIAGMVNIRHPLYTDYDKLKFFLGIKEKDEYNIICTIYNIKAFH